MKVALDDKQQTGIFISMDELAELDKHIAELYQLREKLTTPSVFDLTPEQLHKRLNPAIHKAAADALTSGAYITYLQPDPAIAARYINEYADGALDYVNVDRQTGKDIVVKSSR